jgi:hypothetical protein
MVKQSNLYFIITVFIVQIYGNKYNSQSNY